MCTFAISPKNGVFPLGTIKAPFRLLILQHAEGRLWLRALRLFFSQFTPLFAFLFFLLQPPFKFSPRSGENTCPANASRRPLICFRRMTSSSSMPRYLQMRSSPSRARRASKRCATCPQSGACRGRDCGGWCWQCAPRWLVDHRYGNLVQMEIVPRAQIAVKTIDDFVNVALGVVIGYNGLGKAVFSMEFLAASVLARPCDWGCNRWPPIYRAAACAHSSRGLNRLHSAPPKSSCGAARSQSPSPQRPSR